MTSRPRGRADVSPWPFVGMAGMACAFFLYAASGLLAPWWAVVGLLVVWVLLLVVALAWWSLHPRWVPGLAVAAVVFWFAVVTAGGTFLDWNA
ncbi:MULTISPECIES: hypothetical protein [unclassified Nocardioides]|uniref:hypothetical protein n=1 Tax=unclassified Nocardioides TaxID=2615069 RepID=UPI0003256930|nr:MULTISPECIES: hypothetical protein [unclassified Nocardioides]